MRGTIRIRVDGDGRIGMGHVIRCLGLAQALSPRFRVGFLVRERCHAAIGYLRREGWSVTALPEAGAYLREADGLADRVSGDDILVLDGRSFCTSYQRRLLGHVARLVCLDDEYRHHFPAHAVINPGVHASPGNYSRESYTRLYLGATYAPLRSAFLRPPAEPASGGRPRRGVLICLGGADPANDSLKVIRALLPMLRTGEIAGGTLVLGPANPHGESIRAFLLEERPAELRVLTNLSAEAMAECFRSHEVFLGGAGGLCLEAFSTGIPTICAVAAEDQRLPARRYHELGVASSLGSPSDAPAEAIRGALRDLLGSPALGSSQVARQRELFDGSPAERLLGVFMSLAGKPTEPPAPRREALETTPP